MPWSSKLSLSVAGSLSAPIWEYSKIPPNRQSDWKLILKWEDWGRKEEVDELNLEISGNYSSEIAVGAIPDGSTSTELVPLFFILYCLTLTVLKAVTPADKLDRNRHKGLLIKKKTTTTTTQLQQQQQQRRGKN